MKARLALKGPCEPMSESGDQHRRQGRLHAGNPRRRRDSTGTRLRARDAC